MSNSEASFSKLRRYRYPGFTLLELLISVGIVSILAVLLVSFSGPALQRARAAKCSNNLRQQYVAMLSYVSEHNGALPVSVNAGTVFFREVRPYLGIPDPPTLDAATSYPVFMCPERPLRVLQNRIVLYGGSATYGGYVYNPYVCGIPVNGYPQKLMSYFNKPSAVWVGADGNGNGGPYVNVPETIERRIAYDHGTKADPKTHLLMLDGHVELRNLDEMKANKNNFWADPTKPQG